MFARTHTVRPYKFVRLRTNPSLLQRVAKRREGLKKQHSVLFFPERDRARRRDKVDASNYNNRPSKNIGEQTDEVLQGKVTFPSHKTPSNTKIYL